MGFEALVQITLERGDAGTVTAFEAAVVSDRAGCSSTRPGRRRRNTRLARCGEPGVP
jgi:hypothetical protein